MQYLVIIERSNGMYRALIPDLAGLAAEGATREEALRKAQQAAADYLSRVEVATIDVETPTSPTMRPDSPQAWLKAAGKFVGDEEAMLQHLEEIYAERRRQRAQVDREAGLSDAD
jgi:predicted RNase H-like HicB family nuclease